MDYVIPVLGGLRLERVTSLDLDRLYSQLLVSDAGRSPDRSRRDRVLHPFRSAPGSSDAVKKASSPGTWQITPRPVREVHASAGGFLVDPAELARSSPPQRTSRSARCFVWQR